VLELLRGTDATEDYIDKVINEMGGLLNER